ncbi:MAG TPA: adenylyl-sulfate kinase [Jiangellaceae bacterium]
MTSRSEEHAALPTFVPSAAVAGQIDLILDGVHGPVRDAIVAVPAQTGKQAEEAGGLLLCDEEGAPFASLTLVAERTADAVPTGAATEADQTELTGTLTRLGDPHARPFAALRRTPAELRSELGGDSAIAVATARPLLRTETDELVVRATDMQARIVVLPLTADPSGPPADVLVRAVRAGADQLTTPAGTALVVPLPISSGAERGIGEFATAAGITLHDGGELDPRRWTEIRRTLDGDQERLDSIVGPTAAAVLREWRPPRATRGLTVFFTGLSGSGKSTVARGVAEVIRDRGRTVTSVDGDVARRLLSAGLTFSRADRDLNILRIGWVASEITRHHGVAICAPIAPYAATRAQVREMVEANGDFVLVHISTPLEVCEQRDRKGLYARARAGQIENFTGISDPYEEPYDADLALDTSTMSVDEAVSEVVGYLENGGWLPSRMIT